MCLTAVIGVSLYAEDIVLTKGKTASGFGTVKGLVVENDTCTVLNKPFKDKVFKRGDETMVQVTGGMHEIIDVPAIVKDFNSESITLYIDEKNLPKIYCVINYHDDWVKNPYKWDK